jgi:hypothetical protein
MTTTEGNNQLFNIVFTIAAIMLVLSASFAIGAPSVGIQTPVAPTSPSFPGIDLSGTLNSSYTFDQTFNVTTSNSPQIYNSFEPDKKVYMVFNQGIQVVYASFIFDTMEPVYWLNGTKIPNWIDSLTVTDVVANDDGLGNSTFIVDYGSANYEAYIEFTPIPGYASFVDSWNTGHGFQVRLYGDSYAEPDAIQQTIRYLSFIGAVIGYVFWYIFYIFQMLGLILTVLGLSPVFAGITVLITVLVIGALLIYLKGVVQIGK